MSPATDTGARRSIALLRARIAELEGRPIGLPTVPQRESFAAVLTATAAEFSCTRQELLGECRTADIVIARQAAMALGRRVLGYSLIRIGRLMHRDHTTVMHGISRTAARCEADPDFAARLDRLAAFITRQTRGTT